MTAPGVPDERPAPAGPPARGGKAGRVGAGCFGFALFYAAAFVAVMGVTSRRGPAAAVGVVLTVVIGLALAVRLVPRELRAAFAVGLASALVVFGGCLALLSSGGL
jgi:hypothetical protein